MTFLCPLWVLCDLGIGGAPLLQRGEGEAGRQQGADDGSDGAVLFDHAGGEPVRDPRSFCQVVIERPGDMSLVVMPRWNVRRTSFLRDLCGACAVDFAVDGRAPEPELTRGCTGRQPGGD